MDRVVKMAVPFVSLVVVNYNGADILKPCLASLHKLNYPKNKYEMMVVDNGSTDRSHDIIKKFPKVKVIQNKKNLGYVGVNSCLSVVKGKYIFILNNDLELHKESVKELVAVMEQDSSVGVVAPKFVNYYTRSLESSGTWISRSFYTGHYSDKKEKPRIKEIPYLGIEMVRTSAIKKFGYIYDPDYFIYGEDLDLSLRLKLLGYKTMMAPKAIMYHMHAQTTKKAKSSSMTFLMERNILTTFFKVLRWRTILLYSPYVFGMRFVALVKDLLRLQPSVAFARIRAVCWIFFYFFSILKKRKRMQSMRTVEDEEVLKLFSEKYLFKGSALF